MPQTANTSSPLLDPPTASSPQPAPTRRHPSSWNPATLIVMVAVLAIGMGFIFSFVGALHDPQPHGVKVAVVAPASDAGAAGVVARRLNGLPGGPLQAVALRQQTVARQQVRDGSTTAALVLNPSGRTDRLFVASGGGDALSTTVQQLLTEVEATQHRGLASTDLAPLQSGDFRGVTSFYMVIGWLIAGYALAVVLGMVTRERRTTVRSVGGRLLAVVPYSIAAGLGGMLIVDTLLGALTGHFLALAGVGALLVFAAAAATMGLQALLGRLGTVVAVVLFVIVGNPASGGAYQSQLLPGFWRAMSNVLPNGAAVQAVRQVAYLGSHGLVAHMLILAAYAVGGTAVALAMTALRSRRTAVRVAQVAPMPRVSAQPA